MNGISNGCRQLDYLDISYCKEITDEGLEGFAKNKHSFKGLVINGLVQLSGIGVIGLIRNSSKTLECIEMGFMNTVSCLVNFCRRSLMIRYVCIWLNVVN